MACLLVARSSSYALTTAMGVEESRHRRRWWRRALPQPDKSSHASRSAFEPPGAVGGTRAASCGGLASMPTGGLVAAPGPTSARLGRAPRTRSGRAERRLCDRAARTGARMKAIARVDGVARSVPVDRDRADIAKRSLAIGRQHERIRGALGEGRGREASVRRVEHPAVKAGVPGLVRDALLAESGARAAPCSTGAIPIQRYRVSWAACPVSGGRPRARNWANSKASGAQ